MESHVLIPGSGEQSRRVDWTPDAQPPDRHGVIAHTPNPARYHKMGSTTILPRARKGGSCDNVGASMGFDPQQVGRVFIDPENPLTGEGGLEVDLATTSRAALKAAAVAGDGEPLAAWSDLARQNHEASKAKTRGTPVAAPARTVARPSMPAAVPHVPAPAQVVGVTNPSALPRKSPAARATAVNVNLPPAGLDFQAEQRLIAEEARMQAELQNEAQEDMEQVQHLGQQHPQGPGLPPGLPPWPGYPPYQGYPGHPGYPNYPPGYPPQVPWGWPQGGPPQMPPQPAMPPAEAPPEPVAPMDANTMQLQVMQAILAQLQEMRGGKVAEAPPEEVVDEEAITESDEEAVNSLNMPWLTATPTVPKVTVVFTFANGGRMKANYHHVALRGVCLSLIFDSRYDGNQFVPPVTDEGEFTHVEIKSLKFSEDVAILNFHNQIGCLDVINLAIAPPADNEDMYHGEEGSDREGDDATGERQPSRPKNRRRVHARVPHHPTGV